MAELFNLGKNRLELVQMLGKEEKRNTKRSDFSGSIGDFPSELFFKMKYGKIMKADSWAHELVHIGRIFAGAENESYLTFALSLPTLDFAGPLMAAGFIAERLQPRLDSGAGSATCAPQQVQLFRQLCALPAEMPVLLRLKSGKTVHALFQGVETISGEPWAVIRFQKASKGAGREFINESKADRVIFDAELNAEAREDMIGKPANVWLGLAEGFISDYFALHKLILRSAPECALIGVIKTLSGELCDAKLGTCNQDGSTASGALQDIVRAANLMHANDPFRAKLFPVNTGAKETALWNPDLAIFCGSSAYLSQVTRFPMSHHAVLLSPTEHKFDDAVAALNDSFLRKLGEIPDCGWAVPEGGVAMGFQRGPAAVR